MDLKIYNDPSQSTLKIVEDRLVIHLNPYLIRNKMKRQVQEDKEFILVEDGQHQGSIVNIEERSGKFAYIDFTLTCEGYKLSNGDPLTIKAGMSDSLSPSSMLGEFLTRMGLDMTPGKTLDFDLLLGKPVSYLTSQKVVGDKSYNEVIRKTIKPLV